MGNKITLKKKKAVDKGCYSFTVFLRKKLRKRLLILTLIMSCYLLIFNYSCSTNKLKKNHYTCSIICVMYTYAHQYPQRSWLVQTRYVVVLHHATYYARMFIPRGANLATAMRCVRGLCALYLYLFFSNYLMSVKNNSYHIKRK